VLESCGARAAHRDRERACLVPQMGDIADEAGAADLHPGRLLSKIWSVFDGLPGCDACQPNKGSFAPSMRAMPEKTLQTPTSPMMPLQPRWPHVGQASARPGAISPSDMRGQTSEASSKPPQRIVLPRALPQAHPRPLSYERRLAGISGLVKPSEQEELWARVALQSEQDPLAAHHPGAVSAPRQLFDCDGHCGFRASYDEVSVHEMTCEHFRALRAPTSVPSVASTVVQAHDGRPLVIVERMQGTGTISTEPDQLRDLVASVAAVGSGRTTSGSDWRTADLVSTVQSSTVQKKTLDAYCGLPHSGTREASITPQSLSMVLDVPISQRNPLSASEVMGQPSAGTATQALAMPATQGLVSDPAAAPIGLPDGWEERRSATRDRPYYFEKATGRTTWIHPSTAATQRRTASTNQSSDKQFFPLFNTAWTADSCPVPTPAPHLQKQVPLRETRDGPGLLPPPQPPLLPPEAKLKRPDAAARRREEPDAPFFPLFPL